MKKVIALILLLALTLPCALAAKKDNDFQCDDFRITLPEDLIIRDAEELAGYEAAVEADYPGSGTTVLIAADENQDRAICVTRTDSASDPETAARGAAERILGSDEAVGAYEMGENELYGFACSIDSRRFDLYFFRTEEALLILNFTGLDAEEITACLSSLQA